MIICKSKFSLAFKKEGAFKMTVKQLQIVVHATGNATFALSGQQNLLESNRENDLFIHFQACAAVHLNAVIISADLFRHQEYFQGNSDAGNKTKYTSIFPTAKKLLHKMNAKLKN